MYGKPWDHYDQLLWDEEDKITEFNYEKFVPESITNKFDTKSETFKDMIRMQNLFTKTEYEQHLKNKKEFKEIMPILAILDQEESEALLHLVRNKGRSLNNSENRTNMLIDSACSDKLKKELAWISEEENFALKNRYLHQKKTMSYADPKRMPIDQEKVVDLLRHQNVFRHKIVEEVETYWGQQHASQFEKGLLTYVQEAAFGDLKDLLTDVGISRQSTRFINVADMQKINENYVRPGDK